MPSSRLLRLLAAGLLLSSLLPPTSRSAFGASPTPDVGVASLKVTPSSAKAGDPLSLSLSLTNYSNAQSKGSDLTFALVTSSGSASKIGSMSVGALKGKSTLQAATSVRLPSAVNAGAYSVRVHAQTSGDGNQSNDSKSAPLGVVDSSTGSSSGTSSPPPSTGGSSYTAAFFVASTGSDSNPGSQTQPFRTLNKGVSVLTPGAVLYVMSGTYREALIHTIPAGTSWDKPVTVAAYPGHTVTLKPDPGVPSVLRFIGPQAFIIVDGFIIDGQNATYEAIKITSTVATGKAHHIRIIRCEVKNAPNQGLLVTSDYNELIDLRVHDNVTSHGLYISGSHNLIEANEVYRSAKAGIHVYRLGGGAHYNIVRNNMIYANAASGIILASGTGHQAYNNLIWSNSTGLAIDYGAVAVQAYNNTTYNNGRGIYIGSGSSQADVKNNISYRNSTALVDNGSQTSKSHNLTSDPRFMDPTQLDFRLRADSPAIDSGISLTIVSQDFTYTSRPQGSAHDIGAFEFKR